MFRGELTMENFTPLASFTGGVLIGLAAIVLLYFNGRILGCSGIYGGLLDAKKAILAGAWFSVSAC
jgi:hypothetical protein